MKTEDIKKMGLAYLSVLEASKKVEDASNDKSDDGDGLDKVDPKASKKKFKDRKDKDVDNDGDTDASDEYLHKKRKAIGKDMAKDAKAESVSEAKKLSGGKGKAKIDINFEGDKKDAKFAATKYKIGIKVTSDGAILSGDKQKILAYLQGQDYAMDAEDIEDLYPELMETYDDEDDAEEEEDPKAKKDKPKKGVNPFEARAAKIKEAAAVKRALKASDEEDEADDAGEEGDDEKEIMANKKKLKASNKFIGALQAAKKNGDDTFVVSGKKFTVKEEEGDDEPEADDEEDIQAAKKKALKASKAVEKGMKDDVKEAKLDKADYDAMAKMETGGYRPLVKNKETGKTMYLGGVYFKDEKSAKGHADAYLDGYAGSGGNERRASKATAAYDKSNASKIKESVDDEEDIQAAKKKALKASKAVEKGMKDDAKKEDVDYNAMSDEDFDAMLETASMEQLEGVFSAIGGAAKAVAGGVKKVANRLSTSGRADAADNKLAKVKKKMADKERLKKAKDGIAALKKKPAPTNEEEEADAGPAKDKDQVCEECGKVHEGDCDPADLKPTVAKEEVTIEKAYSGVQSGMRQAMMQMWEKAAEQDLVDTKGRNDFVAKHKGEVQGDAQKIADETAKVIAGSGKTSPKNKGDK